MYLENEVQWNAMAIWKKGLACLAPPGHAPLVFCGGMFITPHWFSCLCMATAHLTAIRESLHLILIYILTPNIHTPHTVYTSIYIYCNINIHPYTKYTLHTVYTSIYTPNINIQYTYILTPNILYILCIRVLTRDFLEIGFYFCLILARSFLYWPVIFLKIAL